MEAKELDIRKYRKFENYRMRLKTGVNVICGANGSGKTSAAEALAASIFGKNQVFGSDFNGSVNLHTKEGLFRISRDLTGLEQQIRIFELPEKKEISANHPILKEITGGLTAELYRETLFLSLEELETENDLDRAAAPCFTSGTIGSDARIDAAAALNFLHEKKEKAEQRRKKETDDLETEIRNLQKETAHLEKEGEILKDRIARIYPAIRRNTLPSVPYSSEYAQKREDPYEQRDEVSGGRLLQFLLLLAGLLSAAGAVFLTGTMLRILLAVCSVLFFGMIYPAHRLTTGDPADEDDPAADERYEEEEALTDPDLIAQKRYLQSELSEREARYRSGNKKLEELYRRKELLQSPDTETAALNLAIGRISELSAQNMESRSSSLNAKASEILNGITEGKLDHILIDDKGRYTVYDRNQMLDLSHLSGAERRQIRFAVRTAAGMVLDQGEGLPIILDEALASFDDRNLSLLLRWLIRCGRQVILFTSQNRTREIIAKIREEDRNHDGIER